MTTRNYVLGKCLSVAVALALTVLCPLISAGGYSSKTHYFTVEYLKVPDDLKDKDYPESLDVTFSRIIDAKTAERFLREELDRAVAIFPPEREIHARAWIQIDPKPEEMVKLPDGSNLLIYLPKTKQILTDKQNDVLLKPSPQPGKIIKIDISLDFERGADGRARLAGKTNLPEGMLLVMDLWQTGIRGAKWGGKLEVANGRIATPWFDDHGKRLESGTYTISMGSPMSSMQPDRVRKIIGQHGENLLGPVVSSGGDTRFQYSPTKILK